MNSTELITKAAQEHNLIESELYQILTDSQIDDILFAAADRTRKKYVGDEVHLRALIEFTNICKNQCLYCGLQCQNKKIERYRLDPETIISLAQKAVQYGYKTIVWERSTEDYRAFKQAGADRFLLRIETTDKTLYEKYNPAMSFENRLRCLQDLKQLGYEVGTGILVGLPGQTMQSLAKDILFFKELNADMIGLGPFIPNPDTPLKNAPKPLLTPALKVMALTRLLLPDINIPATTAMETIEPNGRLRALQAGANVVMPNVTEGTARLNYALYPGKACAGEDPSHCRGCLTAKLAAIGRPVSTGYGFHKKKI